jgi:hypothetical protein
MDGLNISGFKGLNRRGALTFYSWTDKGGTEKRDKKTYT